MVITTKITTEKPIPPNDGPPYSLIRARNQRIVPIRKKMKTPSIYSEIQPRRRAVEFEDDTLDLYDN